jgi:uncharacterized protein YjbJ (UPF0337 family)
MDKDRIAGSAKDFAGKVEGSVGGIAGDAGTQAAGRAREAAGAAQNLYGQAKDAVRGASDAAVGYAKEAYKDTYENSGDTFRDGSQALAKKVQENPLGAILIAGGIGFALALLMSRQPRRMPPRSRFYGWDANRVLIAASETWTREIWIMNDDPSLVPLVYEGLDPVPEPKSTIAEVSDAVRGTVNRVSGAIEAGRKPGMPLSVLSNIAREAPLGSLLVAFLLGVAIARRRWSLKRPRRGGLLRFISGI